MSTTVTVYTNPNCKPCWATKRYLDQHDIPFEEADATDPGNLAAIKALGYSQAPVVIVAHDGPGSETHWSGFDPNELDNLRKAVAA